MSKPAHSATYVVNNTANTWPELTQFAIGTIKWVHWIKILAVLVYLFVFMPSLPIDTSIFNLPATTCFGGLSYTNIHLATFIFVAVNALDVFFGVVIGEKLWGALSFYTAVISCVGNLMATGLVSIDLWDPNANGYASFGNIFRDPRVCSIDEYFLNPLNYCERVNPDLLNLSPTPIITANIGYHMLGWGIISMFVIIALIDAIKSADLYVAGQADKVISEARKVIQKTQRSIKGGFTDEPELYPVVQPTLKQRPINIYEAMK